MPWKFIANILINNVLQSNENKWWARLGVIRRLLTVKEYKTTFPVCGWDSSGPNLPVDLKLSIRLLSWEETTWTQVNTAWLMIITDWLIKQRNLTAQCLCLMASSSSWPWAAKECIIGIMQIWCIMNAAHCCQMSFGPIVWSHMAASSTFGCLTCCLWWLAEKCPLLFFQGC